ncbi:MAG: hypothetical protein AAGJ91_05390 [Pseudomonadota bacterium]
MSGRGAKEGWDEEILASLAASPGRRLVGTGMLVVLGALLSWTVIAFPPAALGWLVFLIAAAAFAFFSAQRMWEATSRTVLLTRAVLREDSGRIIALVEEIEAVDRGLFAFKPSNGFLLRLTRPAPRVWALGLWWRFGRRVGVGGVTPGGQGRAMADILSALILERSQSDQ